jgi:hypothetical protein
MLNTYLQALLSATPTLHETLTFLAATSAPNLDVSTLFTLLNECTRKSGYEGGKRVLEWIERDVEYSGPAWEHDSLGRMYYDLVCLTPHHLNPEYYY